MSDSLQPYGLQHSRLHCASLSPRVCSNSCPVSQWCHPTISSSVIPVSSCPQSFPASVFSNESALRIKWPKYWSFNFSISLPEEYSGLISLRIERWISLQSKGLSKVFSNTTVQKHQFLSSHSSLFKFRPHRPQETSSRVRISPLAWGALKQVTSVLTIMVWITGYNSPRSV